MRPDSHDRFERLFQAHAGEVQAYARRRVAPDLAEEIVSDVFTVLWRRIDEVPEHALPWLLGCARRAIANQRRGAARRLALTERLKLQRPEPSVEWSSSDGELRAALSRLPCRDREVLMLIAWEDLSPSDGAAVLGCGPRAFAMRLHRARRRLAAELSEPVPTPRTVEVTDG